MDALLRYFNDILTQVCHSQECFLLWCSSRALIAVAPPSIPMLFTVTGYTLAAEFKGHAL